MMNWIRRFFDRPWYVYLCAFLAASDAFIWFFPIDAVLITCVWARPKNWVKSFLIIATGSALGAGALALMVQVYGPQLVEHWFHNYESLKSWKEMSSWIDRHGVLALVFIAMGPLPYQPGVVIAKLVHMPALLIFAGVWVGRLLKYGFFSWLAVKMPHLIRRLPFVRSELKAIQGEKNEKPLE